MYDNPEKNQRQFQILQLHKKICLYQLTPEQKEYSFKRQKQLEGLIQLKAKNSQINKNYQFPLNQSILNVLTQNQDQQDKQNILECLHQQNQTLDQFTYNKIKQIFSTFLNNKQVQNKRQCKSSIEIRKNKNNMSKITLQNNSSQRQKIQMQKCSTVKSNLQKRLITQIENQRYCSIQNNQSIKSNQKYPAKNQSKYQNFYKKFKLKCNLISSNRQNLPNPKKGVNSKKLLSSIRSPQKIKIQQNNNSQDKRITLYIKKPSQQNKIKYKQNRQLKIKINETSDQRSPQKLFNQKIHPQTSKYEKKKQFTYIVNPQTLKKSTEQIKVSKLSFHPNNGNDKNNQNISRRVTEYSKKHEGSQHVSQEMKQNLKNIKIKINSNYNNIKLVGLQRQNTNLKSNQVLNMNINSPTHKILKSKHLLTNR